MTGKRILRDNRGLKVRPCLTPFSMDFEDVIKYMYRKINTYEHKCIEKLINQTWLITFVSLIYFMNLYKTSSHYNCWLIAANKQTLT